MDPRPITFQFRKPRPQNKTYQSYGLSDSVYYLGLHSKEVPDQRYRRFLTKLNERQLSNEMPTTKMLKDNEFRQRNKSVQIDNISKISDDRYKKYQQGVNSNLSNYGYKLMESSPFNQQRIYQKQQKPFNIISFYPNHHAPKLKQFPKLTLENKLINSSRQDFIFPDKKYN